MYYRYSDHDHELLKPYLRLNASEDLWISIFFMTLHFDWNLRLASFVKQVLFAILGKARQASCLVHRWSDRASRQANGSRRCHHLWRQRGCHGQDQSFRKGKCNCYSLAGQNGHWTSQRNEKIRDHLSYALLNVYKLFECILCIVLLIIILLLFIFHRCFSQCHVMFDMYVVVFYYFCEGRWICDTTVGKDLFLSKCPISLSIWWKC